MRPTPGTVYKTDEIPDLRLLIEDVTPTEADGLYLVHIASADDPDAERIKMDGWEWAEAIAHFKLVAESPVQHQTSG